MKKLLVLSLALFCLTSVANAKVISNEKINKKKVEIASKIIIDLQKDMKGFTSNGSDPFVAAIYDDKGNEIVRVAQCYNLLIKTIKLSHNAFSKAIF